MSGILEGIPRRSLAFTGLPYMLASKSSTEAFNTCQHTLYMLPRLKFARVRACS